MSQQRSGILFGAIVLAVAATLLVLLSPVAAQSPRRMTNHDCLNCHGLSALRNAAGSTIYVDAQIFARSIHGKVSCGDCHDSITRYPHGVVGKVSCRKCHETERRIEGAFHQSSLMGTALFRTAGGDYVLALRSAPAPSTPDASCRTCHDSITLQGSVHANRRCVECHIDAKPNHGPLESPACSRCHVDEGGNYARTVHGMRSTGGDTGAPGCGGCHGSHDIRRISDPSSPANPANISNTCLKCHGAEEFAEARGISMNITSDAYAASVHGRPSPKRDLAIAATCVDCHGAHVILPRGNPESKVNYRRLTQTCGRCHAQEAAEFGTSSHGIANAAGAHEAPACSDCHGEHSILSHTDPRSPTYRMAIAQTLCLGCHDRPALNEKYGLPPRRGSTYLDSYHGLAARGKSTTAAVCTDCHSTHHILGADDPASDIHPANITRTCGRCHGGATQQFASASIHVAYQDHWITNLVRIFYRMIIGGTLGGMFVWVVLLTLPAIRRRFQDARRSGAARFTGGEMLQHAMLVASFVTLGVTGLALAFPDAFWVRGLAWLGLDESLRGRLHRIGAVVMVAGGFWHAAYLASARGRWMIRQMLPKVQDAWDALAHFKHAVGIGHEHPEFPHFSYFEKAEYWALLWGSIVMTVTGFVLWFPEKLPRLLISVCEAVHFYEAILAVGAIIVWHMYFVFFEPEIYPLNTAMFTGRAAAGTELAERTETDKPTVDETRSY